MKIDESCINHNAVKLIDALVESRYELIDGKNPEVERGFVLMTLGENAGVIETANTMKEVLKV